MFKMTQTGEKKMRSYLFIESRGLQTFLINREILNIFDLVGQMISVTTTQLYHVAQKWPQKIHK